MDACISFGNSYCKWEGGYYLLPPSSPISLSEVMYLDSREGFHTSKCIEKAFWGWAQLRSLSFWTNRMVTSPSSPNDLATYTWKQDREPMVSPSAQPRHPYSGQANMHRNVSTFPDPIEGLWWVELHFLSSKWPLKSWWFKWNKVAWKCVPGSLPGVITVNGKCLTSLAEWFFSYFCSTQSEDAIWCRHTWE